MPDVSNLFQMQIVLLSLIFVGLVCVKARMIDEHSRNSLSDLILNVFLPCSILSSFFSTDSSTLMSLGIMMVVSIGVLVLGFTLSGFLYRSFGAEQKKVLMYATIISNANFLGNPIVESIYGPGALVYSAVYLIPLRITILTAGIAIFANKKGSVKKVFFHPCLIATYLGFVIMLTGFKAPALLSRIFLMLGNCTTPVSMLVVGGILGLADAKKLVAGVTLYFSSIRLILIPLIVFGVMILIRPDPMITGVAVILSGAPAPVTTSILAAKYKSDSMLASKITFVSTILSMITIPAMLWLLQRLM